MKEKKTNASTLGMFDLMKGIAMLLIVYAHTKSLFEGQIISKAVYAIANRYSMPPSFNIGITIIIRLIYGIIISPIVAMMPALLIVAGYGFRKRKPNKAIKMYSKELILPYLVTAFFATVLNIIIHFAFFRYLRGAIGESLKVLGGMLYGASLNIDFGEIELFANGPVWFLLTMFWALVIFNLIINVVPEKYLPYIVVLVSVIGWLSIYYKYTPFCLSQGLVGVVYVYMGSLLKKKKFFNIELTNKQKIVYVVTVILPNILLTSFGFITEMADNVYSLGPLTYIENGLLGIGVLLFFLRLNTYKGKIAGLLRYIGRYSLFFMCIHSIEMISIPWYLLSRHFENNPVLGLLLICNVRLCLICVGLKIVLCVTERINKLKKNA